MATPPSMAKPPAAPIATPLLAMMRVLLVVWVLLGPGVTTLVMVVSASVAEVDMLPRMVLETRVELAMALVTGADECCETEAVLLALADVWVLDSEAVVVAGTVTEDEGESEVEDEVEPSAGMILKGKPYWKVSALDSSVIMMP